MSDNLAMLLAKTNHTDKIDVRQAFLRQVFSTWATCHIFPPKTEADIQKEMLWHNSYIQVGPTPIYWKIWDASGIRYINDLLHHTEHRFFSHIELSQLYNINVTFLQVLQIRSAIPYSWRTKLLSQATQGLSSKPSLLAADGSPLELLNLTSKRIYATLVLKRKLTVTSQEKWRTVFPVDEERERDYWADIYKMPYKTARDTKLQAFQFLNILQNRLQNRAFSTVTTLNALCQRP